MNASSDAPLAGQSILVVEDAYLIAADVGRTLKRAGALVVGPVAYIQQALDAIQSAAIDAAVLDVNLDGVLSFPVATELERRSIPYLFTTGYEHWSLPDRWRRVIRIDKPFSQSDLVGALGRMLGPVVVPKDGEAN
ncbi:response regulator [Sphingomonas sp. IW22]|uniref:response regulator n=1 Tax=Sphingomonas sp. IW22 TaxID=3242489 RepID=UPI0035223CFC